MIKENKYWILGIMILVSCVTIYHSYANSEKESGSIESEENQNQLSQFNECSGVFGFKRFCGDKINYNKLIEINEKLDRIEQMLINSTERVK